MKYQTLHLGLIKWDQFDPISSFVFAGLLKSPCEILSESASGDFLLGKSADRASLSIQARQGSGLNP